MKTSTILKILKILVPNFYNYYDSIIKEKYSLRTQVAVAENRIEEQNTILDFLVSIMDVNKKDFLLIAYNKNKQLTVTYIEDDYCNNEYNIIVEQFISTRHQVVYKLEIAIHEEDKYIFIIDNHALIYEDKGNGSIGLKSLIKFAINKKYATICGNISSTDWKHVDKLIHFYEKQKFKVTLDYENKRGHIRWVNPNI